MWPAGPDGMGAAAPRTAGLGPRGKIDVSGRGAAWLARLTGGQKVGSSNLPGPTEAIVDPTRRDESTAGGSVNTSDCQMWSRGLIRTFELE